MIRKLQVFRGRSTDPHYNLAVEQYLLERGEPECCILYLWQNQNTVVIGRNQNAWKECRTTLLAREGGRLARRLSGGGAVFHDLGNLNFTFLLPAGDQDTARQLSVICRACRALGVPAEISGRNDVQAEGRKFSGNAFYHSGDRAFHHGTLLVDVDMARMSRYLSPPRAKLEAKGVDSVRARVVNLRAYVSSLTCPALADQLQTAFEEVYGLPAAPLGQDFLDAAQVERLRRHNASWEWLYGSRTPFTFSCEGQFAWGNLQLMLQAEGGIIRRARVCSDAMDWTLAPRIERALSGCQFSLDALQRSIAAAAPECAGEICQFLDVQGL